MYGTYHVSRVTCHVCRWPAPGLRQARSEEVLCPPGQVEQEAANPWHEAEHSTGLTYTLKVGHLDTHITHCPHSVTRSLLSETPGWGRPL